MASNVQEFTVRMPTKDPNKSYHIMKFNASLKVDSTKWTQVRMVRENNKRAAATQEEEAPKFGAGSEYGREEREEARRRRYGYRGRKYDPDAQPWLIRVGSKKEGKQYRGVREGGVSDNTSYYIFTHAQDGSFEAHPVKEWYNFTPRVMYKTFDAEEAEERFAERGKILNHWAVMVNKKLKPDKEGEDGDGEMEDSSTSKGKKGKKKKNGDESQKDLKISDMDDWVDSGDELNSDDDDDDSDDDGGPKKKGKGRSKDTKKKKKKKDEADLEGLEDSDDGDDEGREVDYMSDESSESEEEMMEEANQKGVDQNDALRKMLDSDESSEEENENKDDDDEEDEDKPKKDDDTPNKKGGKASRSNSRAPTPTPDDKKDDEVDAKAAKAEKRKALVDSILDPNAEQSPAAKKSRLDGSSMSASSSSVSGQSSANISPAEAAFEEEVRKYLTRKPMTTAEILKKFKSKKTGIDKDSVMQTLAKVLKRINPHKQRTKGVMYLSLKK